MKIKRLYHFLPPLLLGFLLGLAVMNLFHMHTLDRLYRIQNQLTTQLLDREVKLQRLNESIQSHSTFIVKDLKILVDFSGNALIRDSIEKTIHFYLSDLVGKEIDHIDGEMIYKIFHNRLFDVENKQVRLQVKYVIIKESITISVVASIIEE